MFSFWDFILSSLLLSLNLLCISFKFLWGNRNEQWHCLVIHPGCISIVQCCSLFFGLIIPKKSRVQRVHVRIQYEKTVWKSTQSVKYNGTKSKSKSKIKVWIVRTVYKMRSIYYFIWFFFAIFFSLDRVALVVFYCNSFQEHGKSDNLPLPQNSSRGNEEWYDIA